MTKESDVQYNIIYATLAQLVEVKEYVILFHHLLQVSCCDEGVGRAVQYNIRHLSSVGRATHL